MKLASAGLVCLSLCVGCSAIRVPGQWRTPLVVKQKRTAPLLGANRTTRLRVDRPIWAHALLYVPDRVLDLLDIVSVDIHFGPGLYVDGHLTRAAQLALGARTGSGIGWHEQRSLGMMYRREAAVGFLPFGALAHESALAGTSGVKECKDAFAGLYRPSHKLYQTHKDYWAVGASVTLVLSGIEFDVHPAQIADFVAGIVTVDLLDDDFARTRGQ